MYQNNEAGIWENVMSALSFVVVRHKPVASRPRRRPVRPDDGARRTILAAQQSKETYFEMARHSRWNR
jgi:hypothetical protein